MQNIKIQTAAAAAIGAMTLTGIAEIGFLLCDEQEDAPYLDWERWTDINEESNYIERLTFNCLTGDWYGSLRIAADSSASEEDLGCSPDERHYLNILEWFAATIKDYEAGLAKQKFLQAAKKK